ncbi:MAG: NOL1/NOP2/sun family putative RNA methylase [Lachnospiraceae bacterium]|nr:NOL1/NOP2/sun family putative RNA methylase [Lachnospiraceae bacterium]
MNLPEKYINNIKELLKEDADNYFKCLDMDGNKGLRVNNLKISTEEFEKISPFKIEKIPFINNGFYYDKCDNPAKHPFYHAGLFYIQEPSAMLPANRLKINEGDRVLDLCAAPGGKATELAAKLNGTGILYANDISATRAKALLKNLEMCGAKNIYVTAETPENLAIKLKGFFNKILVDAPCSGEGMFRKDDSLIKSWEEKGPEYYSEVQKGILDSAYELLSEGGMMMYSTCTFSKLEDEDNVMYMLNKYEDLELIDIEPYEGFTNGFSLDKCVRVFPHKMKGEGHFLALFRKKGISEINEPADSMEYTDKNGLKYILPAYKDNGYRKGLRYLRTGLFIGEATKIDKKTKEVKTKYSQAYAMTLSKESFKNSLVIEPDDIRIEKYLKGETIFAKDDENVDKGYVLILASDFPLGFGVCDGRGTIKNMYNPNWRLN